ncbi:MAG: imidazole glycerol phosphate synthase, glutamine amidotransferase subunit [Lentisphaerae bacterium GWF2_49_21]|nr:MAG: imidazole glycerol phosphate synthase, glutamine amidotransferase subunit [Lentisphaerae bacterium GWF2_49_21]
MIVIVDYGMGNIRSIQYKLQKNKIDSKVSSIPSDILSADKLIMPGVGHFKTGMENLRKFNLVEALNRKVLDEKTPVLGICLGIQLFTNFSEEGNCEGLKWIDADTRKFRLDGLGLSIPHVGWNTIRTRNPSTLFTGMPEDKKYYFTHSYHLVCKDESDILAESQYGYSFVAAIQKGNIYGTQFHPEKSHREGMKVLLNFCRLGR